MFNLCCIGHITLDKVVHQHQEKHLAGGTAYYFAHALARLPVNCSLVTAVGASEMHTVQDLRTKGISVNALPSNQSVYFENIYAGNQDNRTQRVLQKAAPFTAAQLQDTEAEYFHLGPLLADDIPTDLIIYLAGKGRVSVDAQGYLREVRNTQVHAVDWANKRQALPYISILKVNEFELEVLTGQKDMDAGARLLAAWGVAEVVITLGSRGSVIYCQNTFYTIPAFQPVTITDATGCGDTYMAGYLYQRSKGAGVQQAGEFAAAMASIKLAGTGPFTGTEDEVIQLMKTAERIYL